MACEWGVTEHNESLTRVICKCGGELCDMSLRSWMHTTAGGSTVDLLIALPSLAVLDTLPSSLLVSSVRARLCLCEGTFSRGRLLAQCFSAGHVAPPVVLGRTLLEPSRVCNNGAGGRGQHNVRIAGHFVNAAYTRLQQRLFV